MLFARAILADGTNGSFLHSVLLDRLNLDNRNSYDNKHRPYNDPAPSAVVCMALPSFNLNYHRINLTLLPVQVS